MENFTHNGPINLNFTEHIEDIEGKGKWTNQEEIELNMISNEVLFPFSELFDTTDTVACHTIDRILLYATVSCKPINLN